MKKVLLVGLLFIGCSEPIPLPNPNTIEAKGYYIEILDSCEYIVYNKMEGSNYAVYSITHKGNCKYCLNRSK